MLQPRTAVQLGVCLGDMGPYVALQDLKKHLKGMVKRGSHAVEHLESYPESPHSLPQALFDEAYSSDDPPLTHQEVEELSQKHGSSSLRVPLRCSSKMVTQKNHASHSSGSLASGQQGSGASGMSDLAIAAKALQVFSTMKRLMDGESGDADENVLDNLQIFKRRKSFGATTPGTTSLPIQDTPKEPQKETTTKQTKDDGVVDEVPEVTPDLVQKALEKRKQDQPKPKAKGKAKCKAKAKAQVKAKVAPKPKASAKTQGKGRPAEPAVGSGTIYYGRGKIQTSNADAYRVFLCVGDRCDRKIKRSPDARERILSAIDRGKW